VAHDLLTEAVVAHEIVRRPGLPGSTILWDAEHADPQVLRFSGTVVDAAAYAAREAAVRALMETNVTYTDQLGRSWTVLILSATCAPAEHLGSILSRATFTVLPRTRLINGTLV
jgi:hypothetical protein